jgi:hypothetical protein
LVGVENSLLVYLEELPGKVVEHTSLSVFVFETQQAESNKGIP